MTRTNVSSAEGKMKSQFNTIINRALEEPTLLKALSFVAVWESERAIQQARKYYDTGVSTAAYGGWDTCFEYCFKELISKWNQKHAV